MTNIDRPRHARNVGWASAVCQYAVSVIINSYTAEINTLTVMLICSRMYKIWGAVWVVWKWRVWLLEIWITFVPKFISSISLFSTNRNEWTSRGNDTVQRIEPSWNESTGQTDMWSTDVSLPNLRHRTSYLHNLHLEGWAEDGGQTVSQTPESRIRRVRPKMAAQVFRSEIINHQFKALHDICEHPWKLKHALTFLNILQHWWTMLNGRPHGSILLAKMSRKKFTIVVQQKSHRVDGA